MKQIVLTALSTLTIVSQAALPDFSSYKDSQARKHAFFNYLTPKIQEINDAIKQERAELQAMQRTQINSQRASLIGQHYGMKHIKTQSDLEDLLTRVDVIPPSMVLAQAANESAWGTSRFAKQGSNLFGQWCYQKGCGLVPSQRTAGMHHEVRVFKDVKESIASYMNNLNSNASYNNLRQIRAQIRKQTKPLLGTQLVQGLEKYSERGQAYVNEIRSMIRFNHLEQHDRTL